MKPILFFILLLIVACQDEPVSPTLPDCPNVTVTERTAGHIRFTIDSTEPSVSIYNPDTGETLVIDRNYYNCIGMGITSVLILNRQCVIE